eukprot:TRINITY_DN20249_c0_g1_i1.p2 TRINITY_DN20249_c0_g1~~TRINITY_DN20249_c0_g1_i1.p2  ORF type:complete len:115 (-),score=21.54 TRINITY_DN20249_c0_g1_i1:264-608(-)
MGVSSLPRWFRLAAAAAVALVARPAAVAGAVVSGGGGALGSWASADESLQLRRDGAQPLLRSEGQAASFSNAGCQTYPGDLLPAHRTVAASFCWLLTRTSLRSSRTGSGTQRGS